MILIGQFDSPFVRRVGIALRLYGLPYEHRPWSVFSDADRIAAYNPLRRVPTLVLDDGSVLIDSTIILDHLDELAGPEQALIPRKGIARRDVLTICALAMGLAEKAVSLLYERAIRDVQSAVWVERCQHQIGAVLEALEADRAARSGAYWFGSVLTHADIAVTCALRFTREAHPALVDASRWPSVFAQAARCEALPVFQDVCQPLIPPA